MSGYREIADYYDLLTENVDFESYIEFVDGVFKKNNVNGVVLDAGCGTGRVLSLLSRRGYDLIGVDKSPEMLSVAAKKQTGALLLQQDLTQLDLYGTVSGALSTMDVVNHLSSAGDVRRFFSRLALFMEPGGIFIFDMNLPYKHETILANNSFVFEFSKGMLVWRNEPKRGRVLIILDIYILNKNGTYERKQEELYEYTYSLEEISRLAGVDFEIIETKDGETFKGLTEHSQRAVLVARKRKG